MKPKWSKRQIKGIKDSIKMWQLRSGGESVYDECPLCILYVSNNCQSCPICITMTLCNCNNFKEYQKWHHAKSRIERTESAKLVTKALIKLLK